MLFSLLFGPPDALLFEHVTEMPEAMMAAHITDWRETEEVRLARGYSISALDVTVIAKLDAPISELTGGERTQWTEEDE